MTRYNLVFKKSVKKDFEAISKHDVLAILKRIETLTSNPRQHGCEKLSGQERYRIRQGVYRIIYEILDKDLIVTVVKIGHRREVYKN